MLPANTTYSRALAAVSFRLDTIGLSRTDAELEWGMGKPAKKLARNASAPPGRAALAMSGQLSAHPLTAVPSAPDLSFADSSRARS